LRRADPVGIYLRGSHWYLVAFCHLRNDYRNFRTDKISRLTFTGEKVTQVHPPLQRFLNSISERKQLHQVIIDVSRTVVKYFGEQKYYNGFVKEETCGELVRMTFLTSSLTGFAHWFLLFGEEATILKPVVLKEMIAERAGKILEKLEQS
jgi:predicted DNA-binding transcriptional regulator YafY